jgi:hypothetical protein
MELKEWGTSRGWWWAADPTPQPPDPTVEGALPPLAAGAAKAAAAHPPPGRATGKPERDGPASAIPGGRTIFLGGPPVAGTRRGGNDGGRPRVARAGGDARGGPLQEIASTT